QGTDAYELKIKLLRRLNRAGEVLPDLERYVRNDHHNVALKLLLAREYAAARQWDRAEGLYLEVAETSPGPEVYRGLFRLHRDQSPRGTAKTLTLLNRTLDRAADKDGAPADASAAAQARGMLAALREDGDLAKDL